TQEDPLDKKNEQAAKHKIVQDGTSGDRYQSRAIVVGDELDPRRQRTIGVHLVDLGFDARQHLVRVIGSAHHDNSQWRVIRAIAASDTEPRHEAHRYLGDVLHLHRDAVDLSEYDVLDVVDLPTQGQIRLATAVEQSNAANIHGLLADRDLAP